MITYIEKDITTVETGILAHGVNCQRVMGGGVAKAIRDKWPTVYDVYSKLPKGATMLGACSLVNIKDRKLYVANCYTQVFYGYGGRFARPDAIGESLYRVYEWAIIYDIPVYLPKIGAGLGGLDWETDVKPIIEGLDKEFEKVETYICEWGE